VRRIPGLTAGWNGWLRAYRITNPVRRDETLNGNPVAVESAVLALS